MWKKRNVYRRLVRKPEGRRTLRRPRSRWVDNIKRDLREIGWGGMDWINQAQDRDQWRVLVNTLYPPQIPLDQPRERIRAAAVGSQRLTA
jgi:hypothetical protein